VKRALRAPRQVGFTLLPVILAMSLIAAIAFLLNRDNGMNASMISAQADLDRARYAAEAGLQAVNYQVQQAGCFGSFPTSVAPVTNSNFGGATYTAYANQASGFPLTLSSTGTYNGASVTLTRANVPVFKAGMQTVVIQPAAGDTYVSSGSANTNYGGATTLSLDSSAVDEMLLQFDLSGLPAGSRIIPYYSGGVLQPGATLSLYQVHGTGHPSGNISAYLITHSWTPSGATWNRYDGVNAWPAQGGYDARVLNTVPYVSAGIWYAWDITDAAIAWTGGVYPNYGVWVRTSFGSITGVTYASSDDTINVSEHPYVTLNYLASCASTTTVTLVPITDTYIDSSAPGKSNYGASTAIKVNKASSEQRGLLNFDLSSIPPLQLLKSATLRMYVGSIAAPSYANLTVWRVTQSWVEGTRTGSGKANGATWNTSNGTTSWTNGAPLASPAVASTPISGSFTSGWVTWDVTGLVQQWVDFIYPNYGAAVLSDTSSGISFNSRQNASGQPQLIIAY
jgi:Tfp pilus assembly protein PilX